MTSAGPVADLLSQEAAAHRAAASADQGEQLGLGLGDDALAMAQAAPDFSEEDRADRLGLPDAAEIEEIQRELQCNVYAAVTEHRRRTGKGGRKPGSGNRRNREFRESILAKGGHAGEFLQRVYDRPTELLAAELGCSNDAALDRQIRCAVELLPYLEGKMPATVNVQVRGDMTLSAAPGTGLFDGIEDADYDDVPQLGFVVEDQEPSDEQGEASE